MTPPLAAAAQAATQANGRANALPSALASTLPNVMSNAPPNALAARPLQTPALVLMRIGPWTLALPRADVRELLSPDRLTQAGWPVLALDDALAPTTAASAPPRLMGVVLDGGNGPYILLCDQFEHRVEAGARRFDLPTACRAARCPSQAVLQHAGGLAALTDARALALHFAAHLTPAQPTLVAEAA